MLQAKFRVDAKQVELENIKKSADLYTEVYSEDDDLKGLTESAISGWPE
jgi:hypothetical protein